MFAKFRNTIIFGKSIKNIHEDNKSCLNDTQVSVSKTSTMSSQSIKANGII